MVAKRRRLGAKAFSDVLLKHRALQRRRQQSLATSRKLERRLQKEVALSGAPLSIFAAGSLGRLDSGSKSDLDLFVLVDAGPGGISRLFEYEIFSTLIHVNRELAFPSFSNDGQYLKLYDVEQMRRVTGTPRDDHENLFTARMLLLLESRSICNPRRYRDQLSLIVNNYFRDAKGKKSFRPLFLLNDVLRFWRTLCLNYEEIREKERPWRKKNVNLKFSRMLTVFGTVLPLVTGVVRNAEELLELCALTPLERLSAALDRLAADDLIQDFRKFLDCYEKFLSVKDSSGSELVLADPSVKEDLDGAADFFGQFLYKALTNDRIKPAYRRYLVI